MTDTITYKTHNDDDTLESYGTSMMYRNMKIPYSKLVELFGEPRVIPGGDHARAEWVIQFSDGHKITVYDWNDDREIHNVTEWNIGGKSMFIAGRIYDLLNGRPIDAY